MSIFILKAIAIFAMLIDHIKATFGSTGWDILPFDTTLLSIIGRVSFPVFAFFIVNGWKYTRNREKYFLRLAIGAIVSHIPYTLAFSFQNRNVISEGETLFRFKLIIPIIIVGLICTITYWYFVQNKKINASLIIVSIFFFITSVSWKSGYIWIMATDELNVFYTLAIGCAILYVIERIKKHNLRLWEYIWLILATALAVWAFGMRGDYGTCCLGLILIVALYFTQNNKKIQSLLILVWGIVFYFGIIGNLTNAIATVIPAILILFYQPKKGVNGKSIKYIFYTFYPLHLLILGLVNVILKIG